MFHSQLIFGDLGGKKKHLFHQGKVGKTIFFLLCLENFLLAVFHLLFFSPKKLH